MLLAAFIAVASYVIGHYRGWHSCRKRMVEMMNDAIEKSRKEKE